MFRILLIDDNLTFCETFRESIVNISSSVTCFYDGSCAAGLKCIKDMSPDLVFIDINLPDCNGLQLTKKIKKLYPDIHIIVLSFYDSPEYNDAALDNGANHFMSKDSLSQELLAKLIKPLLADKAIPKPYKDKDGFI